jgi:plastocyanin domain-containing protein
VPFNQGIFIKSFLVTILTTMMFFSLELKALTETYFKESKLDVPYREQAIIIGKDGFFPNRLVVYKGEKVRFFITAVGVEAACFNIPDKQVFSSSPKEKITEKEVYFDKVGIYTFNCPNNPFNGRVMVLEKNSDKAETERRGLASDVVKVWKPKETPSEWVQIKRSELKEDYIDLDRDKVEREPVREPVRENVMNPGRDLAFEE